MWSVIFPLEEASTASYTLQKSAGLAVFASGITLLPHQRPSRHTHCIATQDGTSKQNRGEAMWALHSHEALAQWIRLMLDHEEGVVVRPSLTEDDGLGLCQGPCRPEGPSDEGRREAEGRSGPRGNPIPGSATC
ncbi:hypothetical protein EPR50_G00099780 [Perca flavescens]|uniref:Uncharacterized protein n=1 Tax=Perca flavescens TaxID=8167 RepID=A0A484D067_PERFV|nr:hypothetical protein EPR50_G00099780 [Perca flavescens]